MGTLDWQDALKAFADSNLDLPQGEEIAEEPVEKSVKQPRLDIILEKKGRAGKVATIIAGFVLDDDEVADIASRLKSKLGTGGSSRGGEILIQGDRRNEVKRLLEQMNFKARII